MGVPGQAYLALANPPEPAAKEAAAPTGPDLAALRRMFDEFKSLTQDARNESLIDDDYYNGKQWTRDEKRVLRERKQPDLVFNRVRPAINGTLGVIKQGASDPRAFPRNPDDEDSADVASKALRFIADVNRFAATKIDVAKNYMVQGTGAALVEVEGDEFEIKVTQIRWEEFFYDPHSRRPDFADARYMGIAKWMYADQIGAAYPEAKSDLLAAVESGGFTLTVDTGMQDRPRSGSTNWIDRRKRRLLIVEVYYQEDNIWQRCVFYGGGHLAAGPSPYLDHKGKPSCPIEAQSCYIDQDNNRSGLVRDMRDIQDEINKRRSKLLHELNTRLAQESQPGSYAGADLDLIRKEAARPDGVLPSGVQIVPKGDNVSGQFELLQEAKSEIERMGPNPAILGRQSMDASGRAQMVRQQAGLTEQAVVFGGIEDWELRIYRQCWARARQYWTRPNIWIRTTDDVRAPEFIGLNMPKGPPIVHPPIDPATGQPHPDAGQPVMDAQGQPMEGPPQFHPPTDEFGQPHPQAGEPVLGYKNSVAEMDVDIVVDTTPDTANLQQEQFQALIDLARSGMPIPPEILMEASSLPNKRDIIEKLQKAASQPPPQDPLKELAMQKAQADIGATTAKGQKDHASALKTIVEADHLTHSGPEALAEQQIRNGALAASAGAQQASAFGPAAA